MANDELSKLVQELETLAVSEASRLESLTKNDPAWQDQRVYVLNLRRWAGIIGASLK